MPNCREPVTNRWKVLFKCMETKSTLIDYNYSFRKILQLKNENAKLKRKIKQQEEDAREDAAPATKIKKAIGEDQYMLMSSGKQKIARWSNESIIEGLKTKYACGTSAYEEERKKRKLPSSRTLAEKLQPLKFDAGILHEVFDILRHKVLDLKEDDRDCVLVFDEMSIQAGKDYCAHLKKFLGDVTLAGHSGVGNHIMVFMLVGVRVHWKQIVAYHITGDSIQNNCLKDVLFELVEKAETIGRYDKRLWWYVYSCDKFVAIIQPIVQLQVRVNTVDYLQNKYLNFE